VREMMMTMMTNTAVGYDREGAANSLKQQQRRKAKNWALQRCCCSNEFAAPSRS